MEQIGVVTWLLTRDKASKLKRRAPRKHLLSSLFYGNDGTKFRSTAERRPMKTHPPLAET